MSNGILHISRGAKISPKKFIKKPIRAFFQVSENYRKLLREKETGVAKDFLTKNNKREKKTIKSGIGSGRETLFKRECKRGLVREIEIKWESERERKAENIFKQNGGSRNRRVNDLFSN